MALYLPLVSNESFEISCVGNFLSPFVKHLVSADGHTLVFRELDLYGKTSSIATFRVRAVARGNILRMLCIPSRSVDCKDTGDTIDTLVIYTRVYASSSQNRPTDIVYFRRFNSEEMDFQDMGSFNCNVPEHLSDKMAQFSICQIAGPNYATVVFSNGHDGKVFFIDPRNPSKRKEFSLKDNTGTLIPWRSYWTSSNTVSFVRETKFMTALCFIRVSRSSVNSNNCTYSLKQLQNKIGAQPARIVCLGPVSNITSESNKTHATIIYPEAVMMIKEANSCVKEVSLKELKFPKVRGKCWWRLDSVSFDDDIYISSASEAIALDSKKKIKEIVIENGGLTLIKPLDNAGYFLARYNENEMLVARAQYVADDHKIVFQTFNVIPPRLENTELLSHQYDAGFGSEYWASFKHSYTPNTLLKISRRSQSQLYPLSGLGGEVTGIWLMSHSPEVFLVSTSNGTCGLQFDKTISKVSFQAIDLPFWMNINETTLFGDSGIQVTEKNIYTQSGVIPRIDNGIVLFACSDGSCFFIASSNSIQVIAGTKTLRSLHPRDAVIDIDAGNGKFYVLSSSNLSVYDIHSLSEGLTECSTVELPAAASCIRHLSGDQVLVGFTDGKILLLPDNTFIQASTGSIHKILEVGKNGRFAALTSDGLNFVNIDDALIDRASTLFFTDAVFSEHSGCVLAVRNGELNAIDVGDVFNYTGDLLTLPGGHANGNKYVKDRFLYMLDSDKREVSVSYLKTLSSISSASLPPLHTIKNDNGNKWNSQLFLVGESHLLEVAHISNPKEENNIQDDDDDEDDEDDDFVVLFNLRLYSLEFSNHQSSISVSELYETSLNLLGDPFEEVIVKFITETRFTIFTHSVECVSAEIDFRKPDILVGKSCNTDSFVYDDHWLRDGNHNKLYVVDFSGSVYDAPLSTLSLKDVPYPSAPSSPPKISKDPTDMVFDAILTNRENSNKLRFAASLKKPNNNPTSDLVLFDFLDNKSVSLVANMTVPNRDVKLLPINPKKIDFINSKASSPNCSYLTCFHPEVIMGTPEGCVYMVMSIQDEEIHSILCDIQSYLLSELEFVETKDHLYDGTQSKGVIDGSLLIEALGIEELNEFFREKNINHEKLLEALKFLSY